MSNLLRFIGIVFVLTLSALLMLAVGGVLSSSELWSNVVKVLEIAGIVFGASAAILFFSKK